MIINNQTFEPYDPLYPAVLFFQYSCRASSGRVKGFVSVVSYCVRWVYLLWPFFPKFPILFWRIFGNIDLSCISIGVGKL